MIDSAKRQKDAELTKLLEEVRSLRKELDLLKENPALKNVRPEYAVLVRTGVDFRPEYEVAVRLGQDYPPEYEVAVRVPFENPGEI